MSLWTFGSFLFVFRYLVSRQDWRLWIVGDPTAYLYQLSPLSALLSMVNFWNYPHAGKYYVKMWFMVILIYYLRRGKNSWICFMSVCWFYAKTLEKYLKLNFYWDTNSLFSILSVLGYNIFCGSANCCWGYNLIHVGAVVKCSCFIIGTARANTLFFLFERIQTEIKEKVAY